MADSTIERFVRNFFGYGNLDASLWFVGMEEGGGESRGEVERRLESWRVDEAAVVDIVEFGRRAGLAEHLRWFEGEKPPMQSTWRQLIRVALGRRGEPVDAASVRAYQRDAFARSDGRECLLELLPLPSPSVGEWRYGEWFDEPWLESREAYRDELLEYRIGRLRDLVEERRPEAVVFYSLSYLDYWREIAGRLRRRDLGVGTGDWVWFGEGGGTEFVVCQHPAAFGGTNAFFEAVGRLVGASS
jgi:hypothetical protein